VGRRARRHVGPAMASGVAVSSGRKDVGLDEAQANGKATLRIDARFAPQWCLPG
jgi:hypothetical protein